MDQLDRVVLGCCLFVAATAFSTSTLAARYAFSTLPVLTGGKQSTVVAINNLGQVVGYTAFNAACFGCGGRTQATFWDNNTAVRIPAFTNSYATDINDAGQVVGWSSETYTTHYTAFVWQSGTPSSATYLETLKYNETARGINSQGDIVGIASEYGGFGTGVIWSASSGTSYLESKSTTVDINDSGMVVGTYGGNAVVWSGGTLSTLDDLGGNYSVPAAINNLGQVVGYSMTASFTPRATVWNGTSVMDLGSFGGNSNATGINDLGQIVGVSLTATGDRRAFLWDGAALLDLNTLLGSSTVADGWQLLDAADINDNGQIVGLAHNSFSGQYSSYLLTPVPLPATAWLFASAIVGAGIVGRRRKKAAS